MHPWGMASIAVRVEIGEDQDSGVARSSRAGTKRRVKADPTSRGCPGRSGREPRIQTFRRPFLSRTVVMVAVDTRARVLIASGVRDIETATPVEDDRVAHLAGRGDRVKCHTGGDRMTIAQSQRLITAMRINLLDLRAHLREANFASSENPLELGIWRRL
jgi:hypothetical protein